MRADDFEFVHSFEGDPVSGAIDELPPTLRLNKFFIVFYITKLPDEICNLFGFSQTEALYQSFASSLTLT